MYSWLLWLPLLFLPNLGLENETPFGTLSISDYLVGPYLLLLILSIPYLRKHNPPNGGTQAGLLTPLLLFFVVWAALSTITIPFRYLYPDQGERQVIFGLLKIGKLGLYGLAGMFTIQALSLSTPLWKRRFDWVLTVIGALIGITLLVSGNQIEVLAQPRFAGRVQPAAQVYMENPISVLMGILLVYLVAKVVEEKHVSPWRIATSVVLILMTLGFVFAEGRGGWLAAIIGVAYIFLNRATFRTIQIVAAGSLVVFFAYHQFPSFAELVDRTLQPDQEFLQQYNAGIFGLDDGARLIIFQTEAPKILNSPLLGTGFFHRGGLSGIFTTGSHNFFLQMFLEVGIPGGLVILILLRQVWRHASSAASTQSGLALPAKAALIAVIISALSGEYFYGGTVLLIFWLTYAPVGAQAAIPRSVRSRTAAPTIVTQSGVSSRVIDTN